MFDEQYHTLCILHFKDIVIILFILAEDGMISIISTTPGLIDDEDVEVSSPGDGAATNKGSGSGRDDATQPYMSM